jgi:NADP-dependent 3-hydroxy acid dehydrogenase YdfG
MNKVIITWVSEWLGYEVAKQLLWKWLEIVWLSRSKPDLDIIHFSVDFTDEAGLQETIQKIKHQHPVFDAVINCAGIMSIEELDAISQGELKKVFEINVFAPVLLVSGLTQEIKNNEADIVNVASTVWLKAYPSQCAYGASKWAMRWVTENFQLEFKGTKTRVIGFNPGWFRSRILEKVTWIKSDLSAYMMAEDIATALIQTLELPKNMEVSQITINRK